MSGARNGRRTVTDIGSGAETLQLQVPKLRQGGYIPSFIERKIEAVLGELGIARVSAGQVRQLCTALDEKVRKFREGPLGEIRYVGVDALYEKVRLFRHDPASCKHANRDKDVSHLLRTRGAAGRRQCGCDLLPAVKTGVKTGGPNARVY